jgi:hypothetical protein
MNLLLFSCLSNDVDEAPASVDDLLHRATLKCDFHLIGCECECLDLRLCCGGRDGELVAKLPVDLDWELTRARSKE